MRRDLPPGVTEQARKARLIGLPWGFGLGSRTILDPSQGDPEPIGRSSGQTGTVSQEIVVGLWVSTKPGATDASVRPTSASRQVAKCARNREQARLIQVKAKRWLETYRIVYGHSGRKPVGTIYRISFYKTLFDSTGHRADPCQGTVEVRGESRDIAIESARHRFAELKGIPIWTLYADYDVVEELPARRRISGSVWIKSIGDHALIVRRR